MPGFHSLLNGVAKLSPALIPEPNMLMATPAGAQEDSMTHDKLSVSFCVNFTQTPNVQMHFNTLKKKQECEKQIFRIK